MIPVDAIARVEVLKDGASAIYGADAVAGVFNVILKDNVQGSTVRAFYGDFPGDISANTFRGSAYTGATSGKLKVFALANYMRQEKILYGELSPKIVSLLAGTTPGTFVAPVGANNPITGAVIPAGTAVAARTFTDLDDLNAQALAWCEGDACDRRWPDDDRLTVRQAAQAERPSLMGLPEHDYPVAERLEVHAGKTPYVRFDLNDYSIPHTHVRRTLTVLADPDRLRVLDGATVLATHRRSWDRRAQIEQEVHVQALVDHKRGARAHRATDRLTQAVPAVTEWLQRAAARGHNLGSVTAALSKLLDRYGAKPMHAAVVEALARDVPHPNAVRLALERARHADQTPPPVDTPLSERARSLEVTVQAHALDAYDALGPVAHPTSEPTSGPTDEPTTAPGPPPTHPHDHP
jgi:hypothetical protein